jgi:hypothetical protein
VSAPRPEPRKLPIDEILGRATHLTFLRTSLRESLFGILEQFRIEDVEACVI